MPTYRRGPEGVIITPSSTGQTLPSGGVTLLNTTAGSANYLIDAPVPGVKKYIFSFGNTTVANTVITSTASITFNGTNNKLSFAQTAGGANIALEGITATRWGILSSTGVTLATTN